jgi:hypothetical protein
MAEIGEIYIKFIQLTIQNLIEVKIVVIVIF